MEEMQTRKINLAGISRGFVKDRIKRAGTGMLDALLPPRCPVSGDPVSSPGELSAETWAGIDFLSAPHCAICGFPFEYDQGANAICGACTEKLPSYDIARSVARYNGTMRDLVLGFKHADKTHGAVLFGRWLAGLYSDLPEPDDPPSSSFLVPVPLHRRRLLKRRYNQSALLAYATAGELAHRGQGGNLKVLPDLLLRSRNTPVQDGSATRRAQNVQGAFSVNPRRGTAFTGARIVLIDDVYTTGSTLRECAKVLKRAGVTTVFALTLARVVRPEIT
jgi:ComF family protein